MIRAEQYSTIALCLACSTILAENWMGACLGITDGDTIEVVRETKEVKVRLHGTDCPERKQPFSAKAKRFTSGLCWGKVMKVRVVATDRYKRAVAVVTLPDGRILNHELVKAGYAWHYVKYARDDKRLAELEAEARKAKRGLCAGKSPIPPWEWRKAKKKGD